MDQMQQGVELNFDASRVAPNTGTLDPIPAGWYNAAIDNSQRKLTKDQTGEYLELRYNILDGQYAGRKVFTRLNIRNNNAQAQEIAYGQLSAICHAVGILQVGNSAMLHGIPHKIKVKLRAADGQYEASNEITDFKHINEQTGMNGVDSPMQVGSPQGYGAPQIQQQPMPQYQPPAQFPQQAPQAAPQQQPQYPQQFPQQQPQPQQPQPWQQPAQPPAQAPIQQQPMQQGPGAAPWQGGPAQPPQQQPQQQHPAQTAQPPWMK